MKVYEPCIIMNFESSNGLFLIQIRHLALGFSDQYRNLLFTQLS